MIGCSKQARGASSLGLLLSLFAVSAQADDEPWQSAWYFGLSQSSLQYIESFPIDFIDSNNAVSLAHATSERYSPNTAHIILGYQWSPILSFETRLAANTNADTNTLPVRYSPTLPIIGQTSLTVDFESRLKIKNLTSMVAILQYPRYRYITPYIGAAYSRADIDFSISSTITGTEFSAERSTTRNDLGFLFGLDIHIKADSVIRLERFSVVDVGPVEINSNSLSFIYQY